MVATNGFEEEEMAEPSWTGGLGRRQGLKTATGQGVPHVGEGRRRVDSLGWLISRIHMPFK